MGETSNMLWSNEERNDTSKYKVVFIARTFDLRTRNDNVEGACASA